MSSQGCIVGESSIGYTSLQKGRCCMRNSSLGRRTRRKIHNHQCTAGLQETLCRSTRKGKAAVAQIFMKIKPNSGGPNETTLGQARKW